MAFSYFSFSEVVDRIGSSSNKYSIIVTVVCLEYYNETLTVQFLHY